MSSTPFSHRQEQATTKLALTYWCPSPYAVKVAFIVGAIRAGKDPDNFTKQTRSLNIVPHPWGQGVVNTHMVKHWEPPRSDSGREHLPGHLGSTVTFREFVYFDGGVDIYIPEESKELLYPITPYVNSFGKQGSFFSLLSTEKAEPPAPIVHQMASDMKPDATWQKVSNFSGLKHKSKPRLLDSWLHLNATLLASGTTYKHYTFNS